MRICYFGTYNPDEGRNRIYIKGLKKNSVDIVECRTEKKGFAKYRDLFWKHHALKDTYDVMIVGYPGHAIVWFAKLLSQKKVIFDALCTMAEGVIISRQEVSAYSPTGLYIRFIDWLAVKLADVVFVESEEQKKYFEYLFGTNNKYHVVYTGADDTVFYADHSISKRSVYTAIFRGKFLPEAGITYIVEAARCLMDQSVHVCIIGLGYLLEEKIKNQIEEYGLNNIDFVSREFTNDELREMMLACHVSLGQFENHERLKRTIPHKCFESLALGLPYITARAMGVQEILADRENVLFINPADSQDLADAILLLKNDSTLAGKLSKNGYDLYTKKFSPTILAQKIVSIISQTENLQK